MVIEAHGEVDEALQEPALRLPRGRPDLFKDLVTLEVLASIEEFNPVLEESWGVAVHRFDVQSPEGKNQVDSSAREYSRPTRRYLECRMLSEVSAAR
jgi:hypothetical protein